MTKKTKFPEASKKGWKNLKPGQHITHGAYKALRIYQENNVLPKGSTSIGKAIREVLLKIRQHYNNDLNGLQEVHLGMVITPLIIFLLQCNITTKSGRFQQDYKWSVGKLENALKVLDQLATSKPGKPVIELEQYIQAMDKTGKEKK